MQQLPGVLREMPVEVIISLLALVYRASQSRFSVLGRAPGRLDFGDLTRHPDYLSIPGLLLTRPEEGLFFANAAPLREEVRALVISSKRPITAVVVDLEMTNELDVPSVNELEELHADLEALGVRLLLSRVHAPVREILDRSGATAKIGAGHIHPRALDAMLTHLRQQDEGADVVLGTVRDGLQQMYNLVSAAIPRSEGVEKSRLEVVSARLQASIESIGELEIKSDG